MEQWPNFFIAGAPRAGTTSLYEYLKDIDDIFMSSIKEPNYFSVSISDKILLQRSFRKKNEYLKLFQGVKDEKAIGEGSHSYLWDPQSAKLIHQNIPDAKIILLLRNPVERAFSHYLFTVSVGQETGTFSDAITKALKAKPDFSGAIIEAGLYGQQITKYLEFFEKEKIKIVFSEEFIKNTESTVKEILEFLEVDVPKTLSFTKIHHEYSITGNKFIFFLMRNRMVRYAAKNFLPRESARKIKESFDKKGVKPELNENDRQFLQEYYHDDVLCLEKILNRKVPWKILK
jgi:hypothetical protein